MFTIKIGDQQKEFEDKIRIKDLVTDDKKNYPIAKVNNRLRELSYRFSYDASIEFLTLDNPEVIRIYEATLRYVVAMAFKRIYPDYKIKFKYSVSRSVFCYVINKPKLNIPKVLNNIRREISTIVDQDLPFQRKKVSKKYAIKFYKTHNYNDRIDIIKYRPEKNVHFYVCDGYMNYVYSYMLPSTGYLKKYKFLPYDVGFLMQYPRAETELSIPNFKDAPKYIAALREASNWADIVQANYVSDLNKHIMENKVDFIHMCESKHNRMLVEIGDEIKERSEDIRLIAIAGPSSSGKTTFSHRLRIELMTCGLNPVTISLDNYYLSRDKVPKDEDGNLDLEHVESLDIELFNQNMLDLINGKEVNIPIFDFQTKERSGYTPLKVDNDEPIIIEGIHALNDRLTASIHQNKSYKIFISPQLQMNLDNHNPISLTNMRLIRRIVRDKRFRNASALRTLSMWESVRRGEFRWIYPTQEHADYVYNSGLQYELCVLKKYALPTLKEVPNDSEYYVMANRLLKFLKYYVDVEDRYTPNNSLLREFIGGSCFR
ncbi:MAG: nucleoside kinase [Candidatus Izimaplasma sp.]|nr:nucleoside kinase [Candidatus Izimaplasma bacterium]